MEEDDNGYWITHDDFLLSQLEYNKQLEKTWKAQCDERDRLSIDNVDEIAKLRNVIIWLSISLFGSLATLLFRWLE